MKEISKSEWGAGEWQDEPDELKWMDKETGLPCIMLRGPMGSWCGYVGVPPSHVAHNVHYNGAPAHEAEAYYIGLRKALRSLDSFKEEYPPSVLDAINGIIVHGGLTFSDHLDSSNNWYFGFDCWHAFDLMPAMIALRKRHPELQAIHDECPHDLTDVYRNAAYVKTECKKLAKQLAAIKVDVPQWTGSDS